MSGVALPDTFTQWCDERGVFLHPQLRVCRAPKPTEDEEDEFQAEPGAWMVLAQGDIPCGEAVAHIPIDCVLSVKTSQLARVPAFIEALDTHREDAALHLALCLLYEQQLGQASAFAGYFATLPRSAPLPLLWAHDPLSPCARWFRGTEAHRVLGRNELPHGQSGNAKAGYSMVSFFPGCHADLKPRIHAYWQKVGRHVLEAAGVPQSWAAFLDAFTLVSSRAFVLNVYLGLSMVPMADLFNHTEQHNVQVEVEQAVCLDCGSQRHRRCTGAAPSSPSNEHFDTVDVRCIEAIPEGEEVINTYGDLDNAELLCQYGFVLDAKTGRERCSWDLAVEGEAAQVRLALAQAGCVESPQNLLSGKNTRPGIQPAAPIASAEALCLYFDAWGEPSDAFWRLFFLGALHAKGSAASVEECKQALDWLRTEGRGEPVDVEGASAATSAALDSVGVASAALAQLARQRLAGLYISTHEDEALHLLQHPKGVLRSCVLHALHEMDALHAATTRMDHLVTQTRAARVPRDS